MAPIIRSPQFLTQVRDNRAISMTALFGLESLSRAILITILPLQGIELFRNAKSLSDALFIASLFGLVSTLNIAALIQLIARRYVYTLGIIMIALASLLFLVETPKAYIIAMTLRASGTGMITAIMSLYVMDLIQKQELSRFEPRRISISAVSWIVGPTLGVWLYQNTGHWSPYVVSFCAALGALSYFWWLRLGPGRVIRAARSNPQHPMLAVVHFFGRKHLRISYLIVLARAMFWVTLFIYSPIYITQAGIDEIYAGLFLSGINCILFAAPLVGMLARKTGTRHLLLMAFVLLACLLFGLFLLGAPKLPGLAIWFAAALCAFIVDVLGNIPFMRLVKSHERADMTMVFSTWRDMSEAATPGLAGVVLSFAPLQALFLVLSLGMAGMAGLVTKLPKRL